MGFLERVRRLFGARRRAEAEPPGELITPRARWADLATGDEALRALKEVAAETPTAANELGGGIGALLTGPSKAGNALAAEAIAADLDAALYRVDLGAVVNKYLGETEKALDAVFARAEELDVVLLLDEGDALLSRRTDVEDSHDRYSNLELDYLLQRIESLGGLAIVATMSRDEALLEELRKRLRYVVDLTPG
jgi:SpoVK/Ycf46/Vps4 family AAA+-type ATPase